jgi:hypothetical protein
MIIRGLSDARRSAPSVAGAVVRQTTEGRRPAISVARHAMSG